MFPGCNQHHQRMLLFHSLCLLSMFRFCVSFHRSNVHFRRPTIAMASIVDIPSLSSDLGATKDTIENQFHTEILSFKKLKAPRKIFQRIEEHDKNQTLSCRMIFDGFRALQKLERNDLCQDILPIWEKLLISSLGSTKPLEDVRNSSMVFINECCKRGKVNVAEHIIAASNENQISLSPQVYVDILRGHMSYRNFDRMLYYLEVLRATSSRLDDDTAKSILKATLREADTKTIITVLSALLSDDYLQDYESCQLIAGHYLRQLDFVKGAVSMETLPVADRPEMAFIGRSNVGKSSLINMLCNRKKLAYTSKVPGKTSEFNYFAASGGNKEAGSEQSFYLVDLPGVGFAEATKVQRASWLNLLREFVVQRDTLRLLFHLIDSRHGFLEADSECFELLRTLPPQVNYVIIMTKVDKNRGSKANEGVIYGVQKELAKYGRENVTIISTSSESRQGGSAVWEVILKSITDN